MPQAKAAAAKAVQLDPALAEGHVSLAGEGLSRGGRLHGLDWRGPQTGRPARRSALRGFEAAHGNPALNGAVWRAADARWPRFTFAWLGWTLPLFVTEVT